MLGFAATRDLALALALDALGSSQHPLRGRLREHAFRGAVAAQTIASCSRGAVRGGDAFIAALMRDLGRVLLLEVYGDPYAALEARETDLLASERQRYGVDHAELGAACLLRWGLPEATCAAISAHHDPSGAGPLGAVVSLADAVEAGGEASEPHSLDLKGRWLELAQRAMADSGGALLLAA